jgi:hypothetical protein
MGNRTQLVVLLLVCSGLGCTGLRAAPDLPDGGGLAGAHGGAGGRAGAGGNKTDGGLDGPACNAGTACTSPNPCRVGVTTCAAGGPVCTPTDEPQANGTVCGEDMVCTNGNCAACTAGTACAVNGKPCRSGTISCATGAPVCTESNDQPNGTACGSGLVCQSGQCTPCQGGANCSPSNPCHQGTLSCTTGAPECTDTGVNVAAGTTCGSNRVCSAKGTCGECTAEATCAVSGRPCRTGAITCNTGAPICVEAGNVPNGTTCGTNQVCSAGACVACTAGLACTPANPCHAGFTSCAPTITCADSGANLVNGTVCGTNRVCNNGSCAACTAGAACQPTNVCRTGATSCVTGTSVCAETGNRPNGTSCGTNQVCNNGACVACTAGGACTPTNPCHTGTLSCSSGTSVCTDTGTLAADGKTCGTNLVCKAGSCVTCTAGVTCSPTNPCKLGKTSCATGTSVCMESGNRPTGTLCGDPQSCTAGVLTSAEMCDATQACVTTTSNCAGNCNAAGTDCGACPTGATMCTSGCKTLATDPDNCGSCGMVCAGPPVAGSGSAVCMSRNCGISCNSGYLECGGRNYCQVKTWGFEDGTSGFTNVGTGQSAVTSISVSTTRSRGGNSALAIGINARGSNRRFEVGLSLCDGGYLPAMSQTLTAWFYLSPASAAVSSPHPDSAVGVHLYTTTTDDADATSPPPVGSWFRVQMPIASVGARLESFSLEGFFDTDGTTDFNWSGVVYVDDIVIQ